MSRRSVRASFVPHTDRQQGPGCGPCSHVAEISEGRERLGEDTAPNAVSGDSHEEGGAGAQGGRGRGADRGAHTRAEGESPAQAPSDTPDGAGAAGGIQLHVCAWSQRSGRQAGARWRRRAAVTRSHAGRPDPTMRRVRARGSRALCFPGSVSVAGADSGSRPSRCAALAQAMRLLPARPAQRRAAGDARTVGRSRPEPLTARGRQAAWDLLGAHCDSVAQESGRDLHF